SAGLVKSLMESGSPAKTHMPGCMRKHDVARRIANRLANTFYNNQQTSNLPVRGESQERHLRHVNEVAKQSDWPESSSSLAQAPRNQSQCISQQLAASGNEPQLGRAR